MLVREPDQLGVEREHPQLAFGVRLIELTEPHRHVAADDQTRERPIPLGATFSNGLRFPNEPGGPPEEVINCRCVMVEEVLEPPKVEQVSLV